MNEETSYRLLTENFPGVVFLFDDDLRYTAAAGRGLEDIGMTPEDLEGKTLAEVYDEETRAFLEPKYREAIAGETVEFDIEFGDRFFSVDLFPTDGNDGTYMGVARDVTPSRRREEQFKRRMQQFETIAGRVPLVFFAMDPDGTFTQSLGRGLESLGLEAGQVVGESVFDLYAGFPDLLSSVERALEGERVETTNEIGDAVFRFWTRPVYASGELDQVIGVGLDITDRYRQRERLAAVNDATDDLLYARTPEEIASRTVGIVEEVIDEPLTAVWTYQEEGRFDPLAVSEAARGVVGAEDFESGPPPLTIDSWEGRVFESGEPAVATDYASLEDPSHGGGPLASVLCVPLGEHGLLTVASTESREFEEELVDLVSILGRTATAALDRAERDQALEAYREELERSNENLQEFAYVASHDLQEPLRMVSSFLSLLESEYGNDLDEEAEEYIEFAVDGAERMKSMIDSLLQYSRVHTRAGEFEPVDLDGVIEETRRDLELLIAERDASVTVESLPTVECDPDQVGQVFQNLLKNAIEHGSDAPEVHVGVEEGEEAYTFSVADDGPGIPERERERVFEIFTQGDGTSGRGEGGSGIGLAVCERIVERHGGDIWVESDDDGATFRFTIPKPDSRVDRNALIDEAPIGGEGR